jgi:phage repressor protein C with HTH and peptisase S24 domain
LIVKRLVKKLGGTLIIISDNPKYPEEIYKPDQDKELEIKVIGKVVWNGSKENI